MAAVIARDELASRGASGVEVESAGTAAADGDPAMPEAMQVARAHGLELDDHRTKALTPALVESADHVLVMTPEHARRVKELVPAAPVTCLDVDDPIGRGEAAYEEAWQRLELAIARFFDR